MSPLDSDSATGEYSNATLDSWLPSHTLALSSPISSLTSFAAFFNSSHISRLISDCNSFIAGS
eukprot:4200976-Karenia_brevis.AAC.1